MQGTSINYAEFDKLPGFFIQLFSSQKAAVRFSTSLPFTLKTIGISEKKNPDKNAQKLPQKLLSSSTQS